MERVVRKYESEGWDLKEYHDDSRGYFYVQKGDPHWMELMFLKLKYIQYVQYHIQIKDEDQWIGMVILDRHRPVESLGPWFKQNVKYRPVHKGRKYEQIKQSVVDHLEIFHMLLKGDEKECPSIKPHLEHWDKNQCVGREWGKIPELYEDI